MVFVGSAVNVAFRMELKVGVDRQKSCMGKTVRGW